MKHQDFKKELLKNPSKEYDKLEFKKMKRCLNCDTLTPDLLINCLCCDGILFNEEELRQEAEPDIINEKEDG